MDIAQLSKTIDWLDSERRKDRQELTALQERLNNLAQENVTLQRRCQQLESDLVGTTAQIHRVAKIDEILDGYRKEMTRQLEEVDKRRTEGLKEDERLRKIEREGVNKSLAELRKGLEVINKLDRDFQGSREEEGRLSRLLAEVQKKVGDFNKLVDERNRTVTLVEEGRRTDAKRITEIQTTLAEVRKRVDESRGKVEIIEDLARRTEARIGELVQAEAERRTVQQQWLETQTMLQAERDRTINDVKAKVETQLDGIIDAARRVDQYAEANREIKRASEDFRQVAELIERRINESAEIQRLAEDRFRQDWAAFLADDQKRWTTHMLLRDEQWRDHDRLAIREQERLTEIEDRITEVFDSLKRLQTIDAERMQAILNLVRQLAAEYDQNYTKAR